MKKTKLLQLLQFLSEEELRQIQKMLKSPYFTSNSNLLTLFKLLRPHHPHFESNRLQKEIIFKKLFPSLPYSDIKLRNLFSELTQLLENFLIEKEVQDNTTQKSKLLLSALYKRKAVNLFEKEVQKIKKKILATPYRDAIFYQDMYELDSLQLEVMESKDLKLRGETLQEMSIHLDYFYQLSKDRIQFELKRFEDIVSIVPSTNNSEKYNTNIISQIYLLFNKLYTEKKENVFYQATDLFFNNLENIRKDVQINFFIYLINFAISQMKIDDKKYNKIALDLYKRGLAHSILIKEAKISSNAFLNIVIMSAREKDFEWTNEFINQNEHYLSNSTKQDVKNLALAYLYFHQKQFSKAIELISSYKFESSNYEISARLHLLRSYYELFVLDNNYFDLLCSQCSTFEKYIQRNKTLSKEYVESIQNFSRFLRKLSEVRFIGKFNKKEKAIFLNQINKQRITISRSWLIDKINE